MMKEEEEQNSRRTKWGWWLLKLWFGMLCASVLCSWCITGVMLLIMPKPTGSSYSIVIFVLYQFMILAFAIGAATLLLNCSRSVREDKVYRFLSFFLLPLLMMVGHATIGMTFSWGTIGLLCPVYLSFIPCLAGAYILFIRKLKRVQ